MSQRKAPAFALLLPGQLADSINQLGLVLQFQQLECHSLFHFELSGPHHVKAVLVKARRVVEVQAVALLNHVALGLYLSQLNR